MLARLVTSSPSRCAVLMASTSAAIRCRRRSATRLERRHETAESQLVPEGAEATQNRARSGRQRRVATLRLAGVDVREVDLDVRQRDGGERVADRETRVAVGASVDENS